MRHQNERLDSSMEGEVVSLELSKVELSVLHANLSRGSRPFEELEFSSECCSHFSNGIWIITVDLTNESTFLPVLRPVHKEVHDGRVLHISMGLEGSHIFEDLEIVDHVFVLSIDGINDGKNSRNVFVEMVSNIVKSCEHLVHVTILDLSLRNNDDWVLFTGASDVFSEESVLAVLEAELSFKASCHCFDFGIVSSEDGTRERSCHVGNHDPRSDFLGSCRV